jgi:hypothetical protein
LDLGVRNQNQTLVTCQYIRRSASVLSVLDFKSGASTRRLPNSSLVEYMIGILHFEQPHGHGLTNMSRLCNAFRSQSKAGKHIR